MKSTIQKGVNQGWLFAEIIGVVFFISSTIIIIYVISIGLT